MTQNGLLKRLVMGITLWAACACALAAPGASADANALTQAMKAFQQEDYGRALALWRPLAEEGNPIAQFGLGTMYEEGKGVVQDEARATEWFKRSAEGGFVPAQFNLGNAFKQGRGVSQSDVVAVYWWRKSAEQDFAPAQFNLGTAYLFGRGVPKDKQEGLRWYERAADNGHPLARQRLEQARNGVEDIPEEPVVSPEEQETAIPGPEIKPADWLLEQDPARYTIQVLASRTPETILPLLRDQPVAGPFAVAAYRRGNTTWYGLFHGVFASRAKAQAALEEMPAALRRSAPWIRQIKHVQGEMRANPAPGSP